MSDLLTPQQLHIVASCFLFQGVDEIQVEQLTHDPLCRKEAYDRGAFIFDETHFTQSLGVILSGQVLVEKNTADSWVEQAKKLWNWISQKGEDEQQ